MTIHDTLWSYGGQRHVSFFAGKHLKLSSFAAKHGYFMILIISDLHGVYGRSKASLLLSLHIFIKYSVWTQKFQSLHHCRA